MNCLVDLSKVICLGCADGRAKGDERQDSYQYSGQCLVGRKTVGGAWRSRLEPVDLDVVSIVTYIEDVEERLTLMVLVSSSRPSFLSTKNSWTSLRWSPWSWITSPISASLTMVPLQAVISQYGFE